MQNYIAEATLTASNQFHGGKVTLAELRKRIQTFITAGNELDQVKKALFYGRGEDIGLTASPGSRSAFEAIWAIAGYTAGEAAAEEDAHRAELILHAAIGKATECVELLECVFKAINGEGFDHINALEEVGDGFWYDALLLSALDSSFEVEQERNIAKLRKRFPDNFTEYDANNRDLAAEREVLEGSKVDGSMPGEMPLFAFGKRDPVAYVSQKDGRIRWVEPREATTPEETQARAEAALKAAEHPGGLGAAGGDWQDD